MLRPLCDLFNMDPTARWALVSLAALAAVYLLMRSRKKRDPLEHPSSSLSLAQQRDVERHMSQLLVELSEMARQISSQLDTRAAKLELLIKEADEKLKQLQRHTSQASDEFPSPSALPPSPPTARHGDVYALADQGRSPQQIAQQLGRPTGEVELILALRPSN